MSLISLGFLFIGSLTTVYAKDKRKGHHKSKQPEAAFTACADQMEPGTVCSFESKHGDTVEGLCRSSRKDQAVLVCKAEKRQRKKPQK